MPFVIVSRTIGVFFVEKEPSRSSLWQANDAISPEQNIFHEVHTMHTMHIAYKKLYIASLWINKLGM